MNIVQLMSVSVLYSNCRFQVESRVFSHDYICMTMCVSYQDRLEHRKCFYSYTYYVFVLSILITIMSDSNGWCIHIMCLCYPFWSLSWAIQTGDAYILCLCYPFWSLSWAIQTDDAYILCLCYPFWSLSWAIQTDDAYILCLCYPFWSLSWAIQTDDAYILCVCVIHFDHYHEQFKRMMHTYPGLWQGPPNDMPIWHACTTQLETNGNTALYCLETRHRGSKLKL